MKKPILFTLAAILSLAVSALTVEQVHPVDGATFTVPSGGKLAAVQVFSPNASGTVALQSIWETAVYTNAVSVETSTASEITVVSSNRAAAVSRTVALTVVDSVVVYTNAAFGTVHTVTNTATVYTNLPVQVALDTNTYPAASFSFAAWQSAHPLDTLISTNEVSASTAITNTWPVLKEIVSVTNTLATGSCSGNIFTNTPAAAYVAPGETLRFTGTATGGFLRLFFE